MDDLEMNRSEDRVMLPEPEPELELYDLGVLMEHALSWIEIHEKNFFGSNDLRRRAYEDQDIFPPDSLLRRRAYEDQDIFPPDSLLLNLFQLHSELFALLMRVVFLADNDTKEKLSALDTQRIIGGLDSELVEAARCIGNKGIGRETKPQIDTAVGESKGSSAEFELQQARADSELGSKLKKMLLSIYKSGTRSMEVPKGSFELGSISDLFDQMWDNTLRLQLVPTEARFLSISMLTDKTLAHHVSSMELCSEYIDWLSTWVPEFPQRLQRIKKDDERGKMMLDGVEMEETQFTLYKSSWERVRRRNKCISFEDSTTLSSMLFTHYMPGHHPLFANVTRSMQIFSIKITELNAFEWPLEVYGVVAARDAVDYRRNNLFLRSRDNCQFLTEEDSVLHLTGPSRAIMSADIVQIEFQLKVKGTMKSEDRSLITEAFACDGDESDTSITHFIHGCFCRIEVCCENVTDSIQATIVSLRVSEGSLLFANCVQVICSSLPKEKRTNNVVLLDKKDGSVFVDEEGYVELARQIVSVHVEGKLEVVVKAGVTSDSVMFEPQLSNISQGTFILGDCKLEMTVAWSLLVDDEQDMLMMSYTKPFMAPSPFPIMKLIEDAEGGSCVGSC